MSLANENTDAIIWVHADALSRSHPVFDAAPTGARAVYVWDADDVARRDWSLKRCVFVLECLAEMEVEIVEGRPADVLDSDSIFAATTLDPSYKSALKAMGDRVTVVADHNFASISADADMGRFFRYWNKAKRSAMRRG